MSGVVFGEECMPNGKSLPGFGIFAQNNHLQFSPGDSDFMSAPRNNLVEMQNKVQIRFDIPDLGKEANTEES